MCPTLRLLMAACGWDGDVPAGRLFLPRAARMAAVPLGAALGLGGVVLDAASPVERVRWLLTLPLIPLFAAVLAATGTVRARRQGVWEALILSRLAPADLIVAALAPAVRAAGLASLILAAGLYWSLLRYLSSFAQGPLRAVGGPAGLAAAFVLMFGVALTAICGAGLVGVLCGLRCRMVSTAVVLSCILSLLGELLVLPWCGMPALALLPEGAAWVFFALPFAELAHLGPAAILWEWADSAAREP